MFYIIEMSFVIHPTSKVCLGRVEFPITLTWVSHDRLTETLSAMLVYESTEKHAYNIACKDILANIMPMTNEIISKILEVQSWK